MTKIRLNPGAMFAIGFTCGAALGASVAALSSRSIFKRKAEEEITIVREVYGKRLELMNDEKHEPTENTDVSKMEEFDMKKYQDEMAKITTKEKYKVQPQIEPEPEDEEDIIEIYTIKPSEFGKKKGYSTVLLTYFSDGVLVDLDGMPISISTAPWSEDDQDIPESIKAHIGEYIEDVVYCRDDNNYIDYEITADPRTYSSVSKP